MKIKITVLKDGGQGPPPTEFTGPTSILIGRGKDADIQIDDSAVSRHHCLINVEQTGAHIQDLETPNGTFVNGVQVVARRLNDGDVLRIGAASLSVSCVDEIPQTLNIETKIFNPSHGVELAETLAAAKEELAFELRPGEEVSCGTCGRKIPLDEIGLSSRGEAGLICPRCRLPKLPIPGHELIRLIGQGASGSVFEARDASGRIVAVKIANALQASTEEDYRRFRREAAVVGGVVHPNLIRVLGHGHVWGVLYLVMDLARGQTVKKILLQRGPLEIETALRLARQIASALSALRAAGIVHRDVKPENIVVTTKGVAKLLDFGLAKWVGKGSIITQAGEGMGTLAYMPPEQLERAAEADHRSDIYALGASLYHMVTGSKPFVVRPGADIFDSLMKQLPPAPATLRPEMASAVSDVIMRCLQKDPSQRYQVAEQLVSALDPFIPAERRDSPIELG